MFAELIENLQQWWNNTGWLEHLLPTLLLLAAGAIVIRIIVSIVNRMLKKSKLEKAAHGLIRSVVRVVLYILLGLACASALGIDVTGVVALASVVTLALSLALQDSLTNLILRLRPLCGDCRPVRYGPGDRHGLHKTGHPRQQDHLHPQFLRGCR